MRSLIGGKELLLRRHRPRGASRWQRCGKITLWLCQTSYWKWWFIVDFPLKMVDLSIAMLVYQRVCHFFWQMDMTPQITTKIGKWWWLLGVNLMFFPWSINWVAILLGQFFCRNIVGKLEMAPVLSFLSSLTTPLPTSWLVDFSIIGWESAIPLLISFPSYNSYNSLLILCIHIYIYTHACIYIYVYI